jgi:signal transduction histidine kinase/DNA-binding response OmpR family regulator
MPFPFPLKPQYQLPILAVAVSLVLALITGFVGLSLYQSRLRYVTEADDTSRNLAMALQNALQAHFLEVDLSLKRADAEFRQMHADQRFSARSFSAYLQSLKERMPQARAIRGTDANGMVVYGEDIVPGAPLDLKVREFYQRAKDARTMVFGVPVKSRISGDMVFPLIHALTHADGAFGGTVYVNINNSRISELIASLKLGPHGVITLIDTQHRLLHRYPEMRGVAPGTLVPIGPDTAAVLRAGIQNATYGTVSRLDGEKRRYRIERIGPYPVYILVGLAERDFLAPWRGEVRRGLGFLLVLYLLTGSLLAGVRAALRRRQAALDELVAKEAVLESSLATLLVAKEQALAAGRAKSEFLSNMSHEIRSPMNAVLGMLQLLQRLPMEAAQRDYAAKAASSAKALLAILNDILDFTKVEEGKLTLDPHPFRIDQLFGELAVILSSNASGKDVEVLFDISAELPHWLEGDRLRLQQVLLNLAGNAIKFTERGEVVLSAAPAGTWDGGIAVAFSVRDTGIGIAPEHIAHIFDGFSQAEASTTRRFGGTGLGLAISRSLVALMGGVLSVDSVPGRGSVFDFTIALRRAAPQGERAPGHHLQLLQCLVVDDNHSARQVLVAMLGSFGWRADSVACGQAALDAVGRQRYDVVFMDWRMPGLNGWETCQRIRLLPLARQPLLVMVTAHDYELLTQTQGQFGPVLDAMLAKPLTASTLFDTVSTLVPGADHAGPTGLASAAIAGEGSLTDVRVLVVDDNAMNQQVARELLGAVGAIVAVADSGQAAIAAVCTASAPFNLVLMDIQMPDMDGYAATAGIRAAMGASMPPIVAMTANAMAADRAAALAAGMVDHVAKPFDLEQLIAVIQRHTNRPLALSAPSSAEVLQPAPTALDTSAALRRMGGNAAVYQMALLGFRAEMEKLTRQLTAAIENDSADQAAAALHVVRGLAGMVGADRLALLATSAETQFREGGERAGGWAGVHSVLAEAVTTALACEAAAAC